jgi:hypothetical protein
MTRLDSPGAPGWMIGGFPPTPAVRQEAAATTVSPIAAIRNFKLVMEPRAQTCLATHSGDP